MHQRAIAGCNSAAVALNLEFLGTMGADPRVLFSGEADDSGNEVEAFRLEKVPCPFLMRADWFFFLCLSHVAANTNFHVPSLVSLQWSHCSTAAETMDP